MPADFFSQLSDNKAPPTYKYFDGEKWTDSLSGKFTDILSPVDGSLLGKIPSLSHSEIDQAILRIKKGQIEWQQQPIHKRAQILHLAADWIREHENLLTVQLVWEIGKSHAEARDETLRSADMIEYFANEGLNIRGEELSGDAFPGYTASKTAIIEKVPLGLVLAIPPFNYPVNLSVSKIAPALIMGNGVIFKPPTQGSIVSLYLTEIFMKAGLPKGLLATLTGPGDEIGNYLCTHRFIDMVSFTGSSFIGTKISEKIGMIPILFECGGNNPALVLPDFELQTTAVEIAKGAFSYSGQRCTALKYVLGLPATIDKLLPEVISTTKSLYKMGDVRNSKNNLGPLINSKAADLVEKRIFMAKADGAKIAMGGKKDGLFISPTILTDVLPSSEIVRVETFGPVLSFIKVTSIEEAIKIINSSDYGLQASIFTSDEGSGINIGKQLEVGTVQINSKPQRGPDHFPFLGVKGSGSGVQGIRYCLESMTRLKSTVLNQPH